MSRRVAQRVWFAQFSTSARKILRLSSGTTKTCRVRRAQKSYPITLIRLCPTWPSLDRWRTMENHWHAQLTFSLEQPQILQSLTSKVGIWKSAVSYTFTISLIIHSPNKWPSIVHSPEYERPFEQHFYGDDGIDGTYQGSANRHVGNISQFSDLCMFTKSSTRWWPTFLIGSMLWPAPACWFHAASRALTSWAGAFGQKSRGASSTTMAGATCWTILKIVPECHTTWAKETVHWR